MSGLTYRPFEFLKGLLDRNRLSPERKPPAGREDEESDAYDDAQLFEEAMSGVREIEEFHNIPYRRPGRKATVRKSSDEDALGHLRGIVDGTVKIPLTYTQEYMEWVNPRYRTGLSEMLHTGMFSVQDYLDLHGYSLKEARGLVGSFIRESERKGLKCVKIIHGRGLRSVRGPVLKSALVRWLRSELKNSVIAYTTAMACDGGLGATYVLLKP